MSHPEAMKSGCCGGTKYHSVASLVYVADSTVRESLPMVDWSSFDVQKQYMLSLQSSMWTDTVKGVFCYCYLRTRAENGSLPNGILPCPFGLNKNLFKYKIKFHERINKPFCP